MRNFFFAVVIFSVCIAVTSLRGEAPASGISVLIVGGGSSHDFNKWYKEADSKILTEARNPAFTPSYTDKIDEAAKQIVAVDALLLPTNQLEFSAASIKTAMQARVEAGKGILLLHAGTWYMYKDWPEYNRTYVGGGARSHDKPAEFQVTVTQPNHPLMKGVPAKFKVTDELYHMIPDPQGAEIEVLATATSPISGKTFPSVWIIKHPKARIAAIAIGHDGRAHDLEAYQTMLKNATGWVAGK